LNPGLPNGTSYLRMLREEREPAELKHLSRQRKRKQYAMPLVKSIENGREQTESPFENLGRCGVVRPDHYKVFIGEVEV
jgi:hypothetical protein